MNINRLNCLVLACGFMALPAISPVILAESYKCEQDGVVVYSDTRCGPTAEVSREVQNSYSGAIRPGEAQMLNEALKQAPAAGPAGNAEADNYGERIRKQNAERKARGDERRIERDADSPWR